MKQNAVLLAFNRGIMSVLGRSRVDLQKTMFAAETQHNYMPRSLGSMMLRPGLGYVGATYNNAKSITIPFIYSASDVAEIELTASIMRVIVSSTPITRVSVSTAITNGTFNTDLTGWTDGDGAGAVSDFYSGGYMSLTGTRFLAAKRSQTVTVAAGDQNKEHALRVVVVRGSVTFRVGSSSTGDEYIAETSLGTGTHSLAFTPTGNFTIQILNYSIFTALVDSVTVEGAGDMTIPTPYTEALLPYVNWTQSADVVYVACRGVQQRKIERRGTRSWSIVVYEPQDGPLMSLNGGPIKLTPSALSGSISITSSAPFFRTSHVGALFAISSVGQTVSETLSGEDQYTESIRNSGTDNSRIFSINITGTWAGTLTLQRSVDEEGSWEDVESYTTTTSKDYDDGLDNQICYYRIGFKPSAYTSGSAVILITYTSGSKTGVARVVGWVSSTQVGAQVITRFGATSASDMWREGQWSDYRGWPSAVLLQEGRLWWPGYDRMVGSVSDSYESFDDTIEGDSCAINRSIGSGAVASIRWALGLQRLALGADLAEYFIHSSSLDEPLSPTAFNIRSPSTQGSSAVPAVKVDNSGIFVANSGSDLFAVEYDGSTLQYRSEALSKLAPELFEAGIIRLAVQRHPDTRIHCILNDGTAVILVQDTAENVRCLVTLETDGDIEDVIVLPGTVEDTVQYTIKRTINGNTVRYKERFALESECQGGTQNKQADSFVTFTSVTPTTTVTGLTHLIGESVIVWADGKDLSPDVDGVQTTYTVDGSGQITLTEAVSSAVIGLPYTAQFKSDKLAFAHQGGTALCQRKKVNYIGFNLVNTHPKGIQYGRNFTQMDNLPESINGTAWDQDTILTDYDHNATMFPGGWDTDARLCLQSKAPRPCTITAVVLSIEQHENLG